MQNYAQIINQVESTHIKFLYDKAITVDWEDYKKSLQHFLSKRTSSLTALNSNINEITQQNIDNIWTSIEAGILYAAKQNIPYKKIPNTTKRILTTNKKTKSPLHEDTISISKICQELKKLARENNDQKVVLVLSSKRLQEIKSLLYKINTRHKTSINLDETASIKEWVQDFKGWLYIFNKKWVSALKKEKNKRIKELTN